jgi:anaerobic magnesium-protoporphyrin IX monomethyl ester cyclase
VPPPKLDPRRILLVHPLGYGAGTANLDISRTANIMPPLGLAGLAAYLEDRGISADIVDFYAWPDSKQVLRDKLLQDRPAYIGFSCTTSSFLDGVGLAGLAKSVLPDICTVFGGVHVSALGLRMLREYPVIDLIVPGEGEATLTELIQSQGQKQMAGRDRSRLQSIPGLMYRDPADNEPHSTDHRPPLPDLDALPYPAYHKLRGFPHRYTLPIFNYPTTPNTSALSSRGCPYACSYCDRSVFGQSYRFNSAAYLYAHMRYLRERFGIRHVNFYDDQFTFHLPRIHELTDRLLDSPLGMTFNCAVRAEHVTQALLQRLKAAGCWMISLGIETGDQDLLHSLNRKVNLERLAERVRLIKQAGIRVKGLLMIGMPGETEASVEKTRQFLFSLPVDDFNLTKFTPFPGAPLYQTIHKHGTFDEDWPKLDCMHFQFIPHGFTRQRLEELHVSFYRQHYQRPRVHLDYASMLWRSPDSWRRFLGNLGTFVRFVRSRERFGHD